jgi:uncharacterized SAM-dependent methyltransferase
VGSDDYKNQIGPKETQLMQRHYKDILEAIEGNSINLIDLGCGNGKKAAFLISHLHNRKKVRYFPIDISGYMVETALAEVRKMQVAEVVEVGWNISDFENLPNISRLFNKKEFKNNVFLLLGNTLGNFEVHELLYEVRASMNQGDYILLGNGLNNGNISDQFIQACKANFSDLFSHIPLQAGLRKEDIVFDVRFRNSRLEFYFTLANDRTVTFQDKTVHFFKGDQIIAGVTHFFDKDELMGYLKMYFRNVRMWSLPDASYMVALCQT